MSNMSGHVPDSSGSSSSTTRVSGSRQALRERRQLLKVGAGLLPAMLTLHARTALGQAGGAGNPIADLNRNYSAVAYHYGTNGNLTTFQVKQVDPNTAKEGPHGSTIFKDADGKWHTYSN